MLRGSAGLDKDDVGSSSAYELLGNVCLTKDVCTGGARWVKFGTGDGGRDFTLLNQDV